MDAGINECEVLGNGDWQRGVALQQRLCMWLEVARVKHPGGQGDDDLAALKAEFEELCCAEPGTPEYDAELWDVITVAWRMLNREYSVKPLEALPESDLVQRSSIAALAREHGVKPVTVYWRLKHGCTLKEALTTGRIKRRPA